MKSPGMLKRVWMKLVLHGECRDDDHSRFDVFYLLRDPWDLASPDEVGRYTETNRWIHEEFGHVESLLEIGCGEGLQSQYLEDICDRLVATDVSRRAVSRARNRCPNSEFLLGDVFSPEIEHHAPFDLVVACEVLYYMQDIPVVLQRMKALGGRTLVTYFSKEMERLDPLVLAGRDARSGVIEFGERRWRIASWDNAPVRGTARSLG